MPPPRTRRAHATPLRAAPLARQGLPAAPAPAPSVPLRAPGAANGCARCCSGPTRRASGRRCRGRDTASAPDRRGAGDLAECTSPRGAAPRRLAARRSPRGAPEDPPGARSSGARSSRSTKSTSLWTSASPSANEPCRYAPKRLSPSACLAPCDELVENVVEVSERRRRAHARAGDTASRALG